MTVFVTEYGQIGQYRQPLIQNPNGSSVAFYTVSSLAAGPFPQAGTKAIRVSADAASFINVWSGTTTASLTSTNSIRIAANQEIPLIGVSTANRIQASST